MNTRTIELTARSGLFPDLMEAWRSRQMAIALARRNVKTRYTQTAFGYMWFIAQPLLMTGVLTTVMGAILNAPSDGTPYFLFVFSGTILWTTINRSVTESSVSLVTTGSILTKVYFPRLLVPVSAVLTTVIEMAPTYLVLLIVVLSYGAISGWPLLAFPLFVGLCVCLALAVGLWLTVFDAFYRDTRLAAPYALQFLFYLSPVIYSGSVIHGKWKLLFYLNPITGLLDGFRWTLIDGAPPPSPAEVAWVVVLCAGLLLAGLIVFARFERTVADRI